MNPRTWIPILTLLAACSDGLSPPPNPAPMGGKMAAPAEPPMEDGGVEPIPHQDALASEARPVSPDGWPGAQPIKLDAYTAPGMTLLPVPDRVDVPTGCPGATPDMYGLGARCAKGGGECASAGDGRAALACVCDDWDGVRALPGSPCFCLSRAETPAGEPVNEFFCRQALGLTGTTTVVYSLRTAPALPRYACAPGACKGINLSR